MKLPILASFIIFIGIVSLFINRSNRKLKKQEEDFWEKELRANSVRKKPLDDLNYVTIPLETLPTEADPENGTVLECIEILKTLTECKIVCLSGISNTDLKLAYGTANITVLSAYDENFTLLVTTLQKWADLLYKDGFAEECRCILEYAISIQSDVGTSYKQLASIYKEKGEEEKLIGLYMTALNLTSPSGTIIARSLKELYPEIL